MEPERITTIQATVLTDLFRIGMIWRICYGVAKVFLGAMLLHFHGRSFTDIIKLGNHLTAIDGPHDVFIQFVHDWLTRSPHEVTYFLAAYFIFWGLIDIVLSVCILRHQLWAYLLTAALIVLFIAYSIVRYTHTHSGILLTMIMVDIAVVGLILREYRRLMHPPVAGAV
jgi:uncharacterized membrane protein